MSQNSKTACELYKTDFKDEIKSSDKLHCCPCNVTKARRIVLGRNPKRKLNNTPTFNHGGDTSVNPTEGKLASAITVFGHLIYTDILYLNEESFKNKYEYVLSFTDCASRYCTVYYRKSRTEVYEKLKEYIVWVKTLSGISDVTIAYSIKIIQADKAAEYESKEWHESVPTTVSKQNMQDQLCMRMQQ